MRPYYSSNTYVRKCYSITLDGCPIDQNPGRASVDDRKKRARDAAESGTVQSRSEGFREAACEKLGIDYTDDTVEEKRGV